MSDLISKAMVPVHKFQQLSSAAIVANVTLSYFVLYTGYSKVDKSLSLEQMYDFVTVHKRGLNWTLTEANKLISLAGLTTMLLSFLPGFKRQSRELLWSSMVMLWAHGIYSLGKFYSFSPAKIAEDKPVKQASVGLGLTAQGVLTAGFLNFIPGVFAATAASLGIAHFWTMEVDYKYRLQVRPFAYLPFVLAVPVIWYNGVKPFISKQ
jgi:hypothetical protein